MWQGQVHASNKSSDGFQLRCNVPTPAEIPGGAHMCLFPSPRPLPFLLLSRNVTEDQGVEQLLSSTALPGWGRR